MIYITDTGLEKNSLEENLEYVYALIKSEKGNDVDLSPTGPWGQIAAMLSKLISDIDDQQEEIYLSRDPDNATGVSLDKLCAETGTYRKEATKTVVPDVLLLGSEGTVIEAGKEIEQDSSFEPEAGLYFILDNAVTVSKTYARKVVFSLDEPSEGTVYSLTINSSIYSYTALITDTTVAMIITELIALLPPETIGSNVNDQLVLFGDDLNFTINNSSTFTLEELWAAGDFTASIVGAYNVSAESLTEIITPVTGWSEVYNPNSGITGSSRETDTELRIKRKNELIKGSATDTTITNALNEVENTTSVVVVSNRTGLPVDGIPAKSFESIISGGIEDEIAQAILDNMPSGIEPFGTGYSGVAVDADNVSHTIPFSRPGTTYIHVRYTRVPHPEEEYPSDGDAQIKANLLLWVANNILQGTDIVRQKLETPFFMVAGSESVTTEFAETASPEDTPTWLTDSIIRVSARDIAQFSADRIYIQT